MDSSALTHPPSARKVKSEKSTTPTPKDAPGLADADDEYFKIAPKALYSFDEEVLDSILSTYDDEDTAEEDREDAKGSARLLLEMLYTKARKISQTDDSNVEARADVLYRKGIETASVKGFNAFIQDPVRCFQLRPPFSQARHSTGQRLHTSDQSAR